MTITWRELFAQTTQRLGDRFGARVVVEESAHESLSSLYSRLDEPVSDDDLETARELVARLQQGEPLQHVVGKWPFRSIELTVDRRALIPRPETEFVVECALFELATVASSEEVVRVLDLGTGTGAIALSIATECERAELVATDISKEALELAVHNQRSLPNAAACRVTFANGDLFEALLPGQVFHCIVSNPPYLSEAEWLSCEPVVRDFDPYGALVAGPIGTESIDAIVSHAGAFLTRPGVLVIEIGAHHGDHARRIATEHGARRVEIRPDLAGRDRVLVARW